MAECGINKPGCGTGSDECTATRDKVLSGYTAVTNDSNDEPVSGTLEIQSVINFNVAQYSSCTLLASWAIPERGPWSGVRIMYKQGGYPSSPDDGNLFYEGSAASAVKTLTEGMWYFRAWNYLTTNFGRLYGEYRDALANNLLIKGQQVFTASTTWIVPKAVRYVDIYCVGGGANGSDGMERMYNGGGGGSGRTATYRHIPVTPDTGHPIVVGAASGTTYAISGSYSAGGGTPTGSVNTYGSAGGSGGGSAPDLSGTAGNGGSNGSKGGDGYMSYVGTITGGGGQGRSTRAFEESSGTLYAGGGGAGNGGSASTVSGKGGSGGGGNGADYTTPASAGTPGTGSGGGGASARHISPGKGGSGIAIVRWGF